MKKAVKTSKNNIEANDEKHHKMSHRNTDNMKVSKSGEKTVKQHRNTAQFNIKK